MFRIMIAVVGCVLLAACGGAGVGPVGVARPDLGSRNDPVAPEVTRSGAGPDIYAEDENFGRMLNKVRLGKNAQEVRYNARLDRAAQAHADDMVARGYFAHSSPEGHTVEDRIRAQGYSPKAFGENIAGRQQSDAEVLQDWRDSPAHNRLLLANTVDEFGLAVAGKGNGTRWVLVMAAD